MDTVTLSKQNRLFWLGRYAERVYVTVQYMMEQMDRLVDGLPVNYEDFCARLGIACPYTDAEDFCRRYLQSSAASSVDAMLGNGTVLRETLTSPTLAYLQMAQSAMDQAARSEAPAVQLQWVLDDIMAFRGSFDDTVDAETARNITKTGSMVERAEPDAAPGLARGPLAARAGEARQPAVQDRPDPQPGGAGRH